ncbi:MAG: glycosyltransferase family 1 protein [Bacteroidaceae bacterium]|nr:glycosyltransferase family 1 protein [Bacteroidaceae bacterium]
MMRKRIVLITYVMPTATNYGAASALPYHLAKYRPEGIELFVYTFNANGVSNEKTKIIACELNAKIKVMPLPEYFQKIVRSPWRKLFVMYPFLYYLKLEKQYVDEINSFQSDGIWIYSEEWDRIVRQFPKKKIVHLFPDCQSLYCKRIVKEKPKQSDSFMDQMKNRLMLWRYKKMEHSFMYGDNILNCLVGECDREAFLKNSPRSNAIFLRHPHYDYYEKEVAFSCPKIKVLIAGKNNFYMYSAAKEMVRAFCGNSDLSQHYQITFLGSDWEQSVADMSDAGYDVKQIGYVEDYIGEVVKHDIQITPIVVGTGTKGKVLDAFANGLLVIGSSYALENIAVKNEESCIQYSGVEQLICVLRKITLDKKYYEDIAKKGRELIFSEHGRSRVSSEMFSLFNKSGSDKEKL